MYRSSTSLLLRPLQLRPLRELINYMQHAWKHVERPGGSHTALDGKKHLFVGETLRSDSRREGSVAAKISRNQEQEWYHCIAFWL